MLLCIVVIFQSDFNMLHGFPAHNSSSLVVAVRKSSYCREGTGCWSPRGVQDLHHLSVLQSSGCRFCVSHVKMGAVGALSRGGTAAFPVAFPLLTPHANGTRVLFSHLRRREPRFCVKLTPSSPVLMSGCHVLAHLGLGWRAACAGEH